jgi:hypothetical protein
MVPLEGESSNRLFEILADWNDQLSCYDSYENQNEQDNPDICEDEQKVAGGRP